LLLYTYGKPIVRSINLSRKRDAGSGLQYDPMPIGELFDTRQYYSVPRYQRGYAWGNEEIKELLTDLD
jgi:hypothetical protein